MNTTFYLAVMVPAMVLGCAWCIYVIAQCVRDLMQGLRSKDKGLRTISRKVPISKNTKSLRYA